jgi:hypothetical protein
LLAQKPLKHLQYKPAIESQITIMNLDDYYKKFMFACGILKMAFTLMTMTVNLTSGNFLGSRSMQIFRNYICTDLILWRKTLEEKSNKKLRRFYK